MLPFSFEASTSFLARMKAPSWPVRPTALPPAWLISSTTSLFTWPPSTISTPSMVSASVILMPWTNSPFLPSRVSTLSICGPPPCTTTGFMPTSFNSTTSRAKLAFSSSSVIALPPNFTTMVLPWKRWMCGSASARIRAFSSACGLWLKGGFICAAFYKHKGAGVVGRLPRMLRKKNLLDRNLLALRRGLLGQRQLEHAVLELRLGFRLVDFLRQREAAHHLAVHALGVEHALVLGRFLLALDLGLEGHLIAVDADVDIFLLHSRQLCAHHVGAVLLGHVHLGARQLHPAAVAPGFECQRPHEEALEQFVQVIEWVESRHICHVLVSFPEWLCRSRDCLAGFQGPGKLYR